MSRRLLAVAWNFIDTGGIDPVGFESDLPEQVEPTRRGRGEYEERYRGHSVSLTMSTDGQGIFEFVNLRPSDVNGYTASEDQPAGFAEGRESLGTVNGVLR